MKVFILNYSDIEGGSAVGTYRIFESLLKKKIDVKLLVNKSKINNNRRIIWNGSFAFKLKQYVKIKLSNIFNYFFYSKYKIFYSFNFFSSHWVDFINNSSADIIQLHWVGNEMISIKDISLIKKPIVWRFSDMWAICGAEHYSNNFRWKHGYFAKNRPKKEHGIDINRWVWNRKLKFWKKPMHIISPSNWLSSLVKKSFLMKNYPVHNIPNAINTDYWKPLDRELCRKKLFLKIEDKIICFGSSIINEERKGLDLLIKTLNILKKKYSNTKILIFGQCTDKIFLETILRNKNIIYFGKPKNDDEIRLIYGASNVVAIPSRIDNSPNVLFESLASGRPVVAFNCSGIKDFITHKREGWLAEKFDYKSLANGIYWLISNNGRNKKISINARKKAVRFFSYEIIGKKYIELYKSILNK